MPNYSTKRLINMLLVFYWVFALSACDQKKSNKGESPVKELIIVPSPAKLLYKRNHFDIEKNTRILLDLSDSMQEEFASKLLDEIFKKTNYKLKVADRFSTSKINSSIELVYQQMSVLKPEGFKIVVAQNKVTIYANDQNGVFYASSTLIKLMDRNENKWQIPQLIIEDYPHNTIRALYIDMDKPIKNKKDLTDHLIQNRFNYLVISRKYDSTFTNKYLTVLYINDTLNFPFPFKEKLSPAKTIFQFYRSTRKKDSNEIFKIDEISKLQADSVTLLGEAMWSKPEHLNWNKLTKYIHSKNTEDN